MAGFLLSHGACANASYSALAPSAPHAVQQVPSAFPPSTLLTDPAASPVVQSLLCAPSRAAMSVRFEALTELCVYPLYARLLCVAGAMFVYTADDAFNPSVDPMHPGAVFPLPGPGMFAEMLKKLMYPHGRNHFFCPGKGGNHGGTYMMERGVQMLMAQGHSGDRSRILMVRVQRLTQRIRTVDVAPFNGIARLLTTLIARMLNSAHFTWPSASALRAPQPRHIPPTPVHRWATASTRTSAAGSQLG